MCYPDGMDIWVCGAIGVRARTVNAAVCQDKVQLRNRRAYGRYGRRACRGLRGSVWTVAEELHKTDEWLAAEETRIAHRVRVISSGYGGVVRDWQIPEASDAES